MRSRRINSFRALNNFTVPMTADPRDTSTAVAKREKELSAVIKGRHYDPIADDRLSGKFGAGSSVGLFTSVNVATSSRTFPSFLAFAKPGKDGDRDFVLDEFEERVKYLRGLSEEDREMGVKELQKILASSATADSPDAKRQDEIVESQHQQIERLYIDLEARSEAYIAFVSKKQEAFARLDTLVAESLAGASGIDGMTLRRDILKGYRAQIGKHLQHQTFTATAEVPILKDMDEALFAGIKADLAERIIPHMRCQLRARAAMENALSKVRESGFKGVGMRRLKLFCEERLDEAVRGLPRLAPSGTEDDACDYGVFAEVVQQIEARCEQAIAQKTWQQVSN